MFWRQTNNNKKQDGIAKYNNTNKIDNNESSSSSRSHSSGGGGVSFASLRGFLGKVRRFPACAFFFFFFKEKISSRTLILLFTPESVHNGSTSCDDCGRVFTDELLVSSCLWKVPTLCLHSIASPLRLRWVKGVCVFTCNLPSVLLQNDRGFMCHCGNTGWNGHPVSQLTKLTPD